MGLKGDNVTAVALARLEIVKLEAVVVEMFVK